MENSARTFIDTSFIQAHHLIDKTNPKIALIAQSQYGRPALYKVKNEVITIEMVWNHICWETFCIGATTGSIGIPAAS